MWQSPDDGQEDELDEMFAPDREAWRGDIHLDDEAWRGGPNAEGWRGEEHFADWPEQSAGPEYWMFKGLADES